MFIANRVNAMVCNLGKKHASLDDTLFKFLGSLARYTVLAFVFIAVLNRFGVQTASIVSGGLLIAQSGL